MRPERVCSRTSTQKFTFLRVKSKCSFRKCWNWIHLVQPFLFNVAIVRRKSLLDEFFVFEEFEFDPSSTELFKYNRPTINCLLNPLNWYLSFHPVITKITTEVPLSETFEVGWLRFTYPTLHGRGPITIVVSARY